MGHSATDTPTRNPYNRSCSALGDIPLSASRLNAAPPAPSEKCRATTTAASRLIDFNRGTTRKRHRRSQSTVSSLQYQCQLSKVARQNFLHRVTTSNRGLDSKRCGESDSSSASHTRLQIGDIQNPIIHFRPQLWRHLESTQDTLNLDLFWPQRLNEAGEGKEGEGENHNGDQSEKEMFPLQGLLPLVQFRNLRSLKLVGMLQSYQTHIWRTCWLNPGLEELSLEMALEPTINQSDASLIPIRGPWQRRMMSEASTEYLGDRGDGLLNDAIGTGEYLDMNAMSSARSLVLSQGVNLRYLPVAKLSLAGFVVDAGPFFGWFNPMRLRHIEFGHGCVDAGFALPTHMSNLVTVSWPRSLQEDCKMVTIERVGQRAVKAVRLEMKGASKKQTPNGFKPKISSTVIRNWFSITDSHGLKARKANGDGQQCFERVSQASSSNELTLFRPSSSSGVSWKKRDPKGHTETQMNKSGACVNVRG